MLLLVAGALKVVLGILLELVSAAVVVVWSLLLEVDALAVVLLGFLLLEPIEFVSPDFEVVCSLLLVTFATVVVLG